MTGCNSSRTYPSADMKLIDGAEVAPAAAWVYGPDMNGSKQNVPRLSRMMRLLMLLLGIAGVPSTGLAALQRPHCARHEATCQHGRPTASSAIVAQAHGQITWSSHQGHDCPHCPASECARVSPCAGASTAVASSGTALTAPRGHRVVIDGLRRLARSAIPAPPTPPPQRIA